MRVLVIVPTYNEIDNIKPLTHAILSITSQQCPDHHVDVLIVDDNSPDGTGVAADVLVRENPGRVQVLHRHKKAGLGAAYVAGFTFALSQHLDNGQPRYDALVEMDADFSHHPQYLPQLIRCLQDNDVVIGSRNIPGGGTLNWGLERKLISWGGSLYARLILGLPIRDLTGGFNGWRRKVLESIEIESLRSDGYSFQIELKHRAWIRGFKVVEFPIVFEDRRVGQSKMSVVIVIEALLRVWGFRLGDFRRRGAFFGSYSTAELTTVPRLENVRNGANSK